MQAENKVFYYEVEMRESSKLKLSEKLIIESAKLSANFETSHEPFVRFLNLFGTHYIVRAKFCGYMIMFISIKKEYSTKCTDTQLSSDIKIKFAEIFSNVGVSVENGYSNSHFEQYTSTESRYFGGEYQANGDMNAWISSVARSPHMVKASLRPIYELFGNNETLRGELKKAVESRQMKGHLKELRSVLKFTRARIERVNEDDKLSELLKEAEKQTS